MAGNFKIFIATFPFGKINSKPLDLLKSTGWELIYNPYERRIKLGEVAELIKDVDAVIAGTEPYSEEVLKGSRIKGISRVGIGLDNVPIEFCKKNGIQVTYTPDAPSQAVAELTLANIINLSRHILTSDRSVREGTWNRYIGFLLEELTIGIIGLGRIGKIVTKLLQPFNTKILACDLIPDADFGRRYNLNWTSKKDILKNSDILTLHIPFNKNNYHYIDRNALSLMKTGSCIINTSRGAIVDEQALADALLQKHLAGVALDVFEKEPYDGQLCQMDNVILTAHMGASANKSRYLMELGAAEDCINVLMNRPPRHDAFKELENTNFTEI
jgi:D-3-phosphoglycerate dehydrogenase